MKWLTLFTSLSLAVCAAYFSIIGLMTIFSGAALSVLVMTSVLEFSKLVTAAWLHYEWERINNLVRAYFTTAVMILMFITSMGIFGFLSKAHIDSALVSDSYSLEANIIDKRIEAKQLQLDNLTGRLETLDYVLQTSKPEDRNYVNRTQTQERNQINADLDVLVQEIVKLNEEKIPVQRKQLNQEAELGPIKYIADMIYGDEAKTYYDDAVRWVILTIIFVFDPLAIMLLIVSTGAFKRDRLKMKPLVDENQIMRMDIDGNTTSKPNLRDEPEATTGGGESDSKENDSDNPEPKYATGDDVHLQSEWHVGIDGSEIPADKPSDVEEKGRKGLTTVMNRRPV